MGDHTTFLLGPSMHEWRYSGSPLWTPCISATTQRKLVIALAYGWWPYLCSYPSIPRIPCSRKPTQCHSWPIAKKNSLLLENLLRSEETDHPLTTAMWPTQSRVKAMSNEFFFCDPVPLWSSWGTCYTSSAPNWIVHPPHTGPLMKQIVLAPHLHETSSLPSQARSGWPSSTQVL